MNRKIFVTLAVLIASLLITSAVFANAPAKGVVVEGQSVPGISLGDTRTSVEAAYGHPASCQNMGYYDGRVGVDGICQFDVDGGGQVTVYLYAPDDGPAQGAAGDVVRAIRWTEQVSGWETTAGVNTTLAKQNPEAVVAAYPNAVVTYTSFGSVLQVKDHQQGIEINRSLNFYSGTVTVNMLITAPSTPPPPQEMLTTVTDIDLSASKTRGQRKVVALVQVRNELQLGAEGANVTAFWRLPDGSTLEVTDLTSSSGYAYFEINQAGRGTYTLTVTGVELEDHRFDRDSSVLNESIRVK